MADHTSTQTTDQRDLMIDDGTTTTVQTDVLREKLAEQPARVTVKVGNALEF
jgi:plastocyanin